jgi:hypothetical protein
VWRLTKNTTCAGLICWSTWRAATAYSICLLHIDMWALTST